MEGSRKVAFNLRQKGSWPEEGKVASVSAKGDRGWCDQGTDMMQAWIWPERG